MIEGMSGCRRWQ